MIYVFCNRYCEYLMELPMIAFYRILFGLTFLAFNRLSLLGSILFLSSLNDILHVPHKNFQLLDSSVGSPILPQKQNLSSSSLQALLGFPSRTFNSNLCTPIVNLRTKTLLLHFTCSAPGCSLQSSSMSAGNHLNNSLFSSSLSTSSSSILLSS